MFASPIKIGPNQPKQDQPLRSWLALTRFSLRDAQVFDNRLLVVVQEDCGAKSFPVTQALKHGASDTKVMGSTPRDRMDWSNVTWDKGICQMPQEDHQ